MGISGEQNDLVRLVLLLPDGVTICMGGKIFPYLSWDSQSLAFSDSNRGCNEIKSS